MSDVSRFRSAINGVQPHRRCQLCGVHLRRTPEAAGQLQNRACTDSARKTGRSPQKRTHCTEKVGELEAALDAAKTALGPRHGARTAGVRDEALELLERVPSGKTAPEDDSRTGGRDAPDQEPDRASWRPYRRAALTEQERRRSAARRLQAQGYLSCERRLCVKTTPVRAIRTRAR